MTHLPPAGGGSLIPHLRGTSRSHLLTSSGRAWPFFQGNPLWPALLLAMVSHALLIYVLDFKPPRPLPTPLPALDVLVLRPANEEAAPEHPNALADRAQEAERPGYDAVSSASEPHGAQTRDLPGAASADIAPIPPHPLPHVTSATPAPEGPEEAAVTLAPSTPLPPPETTYPPSSDTAQTHAADPLSALATPAGPKPPLSAAKILASRGEEIASLNAKLVEDMAASANRPRRKAISASTQDYKYASYLEAWRRKVEGIGNLNYPEDARRRKLYGNLILQVGVRADGSLEEVRVLHSSGSTILDEAAVRIVHLAAPFAPFPPDIRQETDFLDITRTWQFLSNNRFGGKP